MRISLGDQLAHIDIIKFVANRIEKSVQKCCHRSLKIFWIQFFGFEGALKSLNIAKGTIAVFRGDNKS